MNTALLWSAVVHLRRIIDAIPTNLELIQRTVNLILKEQYEGYIDEADTLINRITQLDPNNEKNWMNQIDFINDHLGDFDEAMEKIDRALTRFPKSEQLLQMKCELLVDTHEEGLEILKLLVKMKEINPNNKSITKFKESAIEILISNEEDNNPEALEIIKKL